MSQEEEKLIEEFWYKAERMEVIYPREFSSGMSGALDEIEDEGKEFLKDFIRKAYRAGKLAGFEMCADSLDDIANNNSVMNNISSDFRKSYITISKSLREGYKSLIEEEKKKL